MINCIPHTDNNTELIRPTTCTHHLGLSQLEMAIILANDIRLEREILGERGHQSFCNMEREIIDLTKRKDIKQADYLRLKFIEKWMPLSKEQNTRAIIDDQRKEVERMSHYDQQEKAYEQWNIKRAYLERAPIDEHNGLLAGSITTRGSDLQTPRGQLQCHKLSAGSNHASIIVQDEKTRVGRLYTWGVGSLGRLGHGESVQDCNYPKLVEVLKGSSIKEISCGYSHSAAITTSGELFVWGDGSCGKLGFGNELTDFFCPIPSRLLSNITVVKVSCGALHTACIGLFGELYVWGACDSGRLGLGPDRCGIQFSPTLVNSLQHERIAEVSCGTSTTLALSVTEKVGTKSRTSIERMTGGRLYVAGPKNLLGASFPSFGELECLRESPMVIKSVAAGSSHQVFISQSGELYCWGQNKHGCCGQPEATTFLQEPTLIEQ
jgi:E3 ubiquitin-protein ligase HERC2